MADATILQCPGGDLQVITNPSTLHTEVACWLAFPPDPNHTPTEIDVATYCVTNDCSAVEAGGETALMFNAESYAAFWPWALLMLATAFAVRQIRRAIYAKA